jgi:hypothetical protein
LSSLRANIFNVYTLKKLALILELPTTILSNLLPLQLPQLNSPPHGRYLGFVKLFQGVYNGFNGPTIIRFKEFFSTSLSLSENNKNDKLSTSFE